MNIAIDMRDAARDFLLEQGVSEKVVPILLEKVRKKVKTQIKSGNASLEVQSGAFVFEELAFWVSALNKGATVDWIKLWK